MGNIWRRLPKPIWCLAPMYGVTDSAFRQQLTKIGKPDLMFSEFTNVHEILNRPLEQINNLKFSPTEQPLICQLWGNDPELFQQAVKKIIPLNFAGIDINLGCPVKAVVKKGSGAGLIGNYNLTAKIIASAKTKLLPLSVKTRLGSKTIDPEWLKFLLQQNLDALIIHCRTVAEKSAGPGHWEQISQAVKLRNKLKSKTLIIANGDIFNRETAYQRIKETRADGVMIGRGILQNPWLFNPVQSPKTRTEKIAAWEQHLKIYRQTWGTAKSIHPMKRFIGVYLKGFKGAADMRIKTMSTLS